MLKLPKTPQLIFIPSYRQTDGFELTGAMRRPHHSDCPNVHHNSCCEDIPNFSTINILGCFEENDQEIQEATNLKHQVFLDWKLHHASRLKETILQKVKAEIQQMGGRSTVNMTF